MVSPKSLRDEKHFTSAPLKIKAGCGGIFFLETTRESVLVAGNWTLLESPKKETLASLLFKETTTFARSNGRHSEAAS